MAGILDSDGETLGFSLTYGLAKPCMPRDCSQHYRLPLLLSPVVKGNC